ADSRLGRHLMRIENELLVDDPRFVDVTFRGTRTPDRLYPLEEPDTVVIHYDVCLTLDENTNAVMASGYDYHLAAFGEMRDGERVVEMRQYVPFNYRGAHAKGFNHRSIGIAFVNPGPLVEIPGQSGLWTVTKPQRLWTGGVVHAKQPGA